MTDINKLCDQVRQTAYDILELFRHFYLVYSELIDRGKSSATPWILTNTPNFRRNASEI